MGRAASGAGQSCPPCWSMTCKCSGATPGHPQNSHRSSAPYSWIITPYLCRGILVRHSWGGGRSALSPDRILSPASLSCVLSPAQDHLEEEMAAFFTHLDNSIKKLRDGKEDMCPAPQGLGWITDSHPAQHSWRSPWRWEGASSKSTVCHCSTMHPLGVRHDIILAQMRGR